MAYRIVKNAAVWWPVRWNDVEEDGAIVEREIRIKFKRLPKSQQTETNLIEHGDVKFLLAAAIDWAGVEDATGKSLAFLEENIRDWLDQPGQVGAALGNAWVDCMLAEPERRLGNSAPPPAAGPAAATEAPREAATASE